MNKISFVFLLVFILILGCENHKSTPIDFINPPTADIIDQEPSWSPDGKIIAYSHYGEIWLLDLQTMEKQFLTWGYEADWSPDGTRIAFQWASRIYLINLADSVITLLTNSSGVFFHPSWSADGGKIAYDHHDAEHGTGRGLWVKNLETGDERYLASGVEPDWSPDGTKLAYSGETVPHIPGVAAVWIIDEDGGNAHTITTDGGDKPSWSPDGEKIAFVKAGNGIWVINVTDNTSLQLTTRGGDWPSWSPDGTKIVYEWYNEGSDNVTLWTMNADGSDKQQLTFPQ